MPRPAGDFIARFQPQGYVSMAQVAELVGGETDITLLDGRNEAQYYGEAKHPKAAHPGRIPGSQLLFQETAYDVTANRLKSAEELQSLYADVSTNQPVISYCNTGHWAATNWFVLSEVLGRKDVNCMMGLWWNGPPMLITRWQPANQTCRKSKASSSRFWGRVAVNHK